MAQSRARRRAPLECGRAATVARAGGGGSAAPGVRRRRRAPRPHGRVRLRAELQSVNPLLTTHPLANQVQRYVLLTTLVRYDSTLAPAPYLARAWWWSPDRRTLTFRLRRGV